ncbi:hypothetical protein [Rheinheimera sp.]|uniref:hypothetical protein n=1 Tax=Rheinheimera sp. TaxID=1869214 RepID=UPI00307E7A17
MSQQIILVTALAASFRRAGIGFTDKGTALLREQLTDEQYNQIIAEKRLSSREVTADQIPEGADTRAIQQASAQLQSAAGTGDAETFHTPLSFEEAVATLDPSNKDHFTGQGKPQLDALSKRMGKPVSGAERDALWDAYKASGAQ